MNLKIKTYLFSLSLLTVIACQSEKKFDFEAFYKKQCDSLSIKDKVDYQVSKNGFLDLVGDSTKEHYCFYKLEKPRKSSFLKIYSGSKEIFGTEIAEVYQDIEVDIKRTTSEDKDDLIVWGELKPYDYPNQSLMVVRGNKGKGKIVFSKVIHWLDTLTKVDTTILSHATYNFEDLNNDGIDEIRLHFLNTISSDNYLDTAKNEQLDYFFNAERGQFFLEEAIK